MSCPIPHVWMPITGPEWVCLPITVPVQIPVLIDVPDAAQDLSLFVGIVAIAILRRLHVRVKQ